MEINDKVKLGVAGALGAGFLVIGALVASGRTMDFDLSVLNYVYSLRNPVFTAIMKTISAISSTPFTGLLTAIVILAFWLKNKRRSAMFFGATLLASVAVNNIAKYSIQRFRPDISPLENASFYSFPSGHSMNSLVFYGLLVYLANKSIKNKQILLAINIVAPIFVVLVGFSRVYLGAHYPTDVIAGFLAGGAVLCGAIWTAKNKN